MRFRITRAYSRYLARGAALALAGGIASGCSTDVMRFSGGIYTGSVSRTQAVAQNQPYPGNVDSTHTGSVSRDALRPAPLRSVPVPGGHLTPDVPVGARAAAAQRYPVHVNSAPAYQPPAGGNTQAALAPVAGAKGIERRPLAKPSNVDATVTGATRRDPTPVAAIPRQEMPAQAAGASQPEGTGATPNGWTRAGGTEITLREGETIYNLSRRFGVPARVIMQVNGIANPRDVAAGQKVIIPTYVYSRKSEVSAPDNNPDTAMAKSSRGTRYDVDEGKAPLPQRAPTRDEAVLPEVPAVRARNSIAAQDTSRSTGAGSQSQGQSYLVVSGDTLYKIAQRSGVTVTALKQANGLSDGTLRVGQKLIIPPAGAHVASAAKHDVPAGVDPIITGGAGPAQKSGQSASRLPTYTPPAQKADKAIEDAVKVAAVAPDATGIGRMRWPVRGRVISAFGSSSGGRANDGIDIAVPVGTPVKAAENGVVIYSGDGLKEFGNTVLVRHENGLVSVYGHNSELLVKRGQTVRRGQEIARAGNSGNAEMPKLHFEVRKNSSPVDPRKYLE